MSNFSDSDDGSNSRKSDDGRSLINLDSFKKDLCTRISQVHSTGSFASFGVIDSFTQPGISVGPIGVVRMPLSDEDARSIILESHKASSGKGIETVVDDSTRKTWNIDAGKICFLNERWQSCFDRTLERVAGELGVMDGTTSIRAEFYEMVLYEEGAMFKAQVEYLKCKSHQDSS